MFFTFIFIIPVNDYARTLNFLTYETEFVLFFAVLEKSVLPMG